MGTDRRARLLARFRALAGERLGRLGRDWVHLEGHPDDAEVSERLLREIHTLKGEARMMGFAEANIACHAVEELLVHARDRAWRVDPQIADLVLAGFDRVSSLTSTEGGEEGSAEAYQAQVHAQLEAQPAIETTAEDTPGDLSDDPEPTSETDEGVVAARPPVNTFLRVGMERFDQLTELAGALAVRHRRQERSLNELRGASRDWLSNSRLPLEADTIERLDLAQLRLLAARLVTAVQEGRRSASSLNQRLDTLVEQTFDDGLLLEELDDTVRELRFLPLDSLFEELPRAARDLARAAGKRVRVVCQGGDVEVDRQVLEHLREPLVHLFRNSVDHGIDTPDDRLEAGKAARGLIEVSARSEGSSVVLTVRDDGSGIDLESLAERAVRGGVLNADEIRGMGRDGVQALVFRSGLSTRDEVTDISGRGLGLAAVRSSVQAMGGGVRIVSTTAEGTVFEIRAPVSTVLSHAVMVEVGDRIVGLPAELVERAHVLEATPVEQTARGPVFRLDGEPIPLVDLSGVLGGPVRPSKEGAPVVVVAHEGRRWGLRVDGFAGDQRVVQRPLGGFVERLPLVQSTVALPEGGLALMLDVGQIVREASFRQRYRAPVAANAAATATTVLVVDDSEFTRDMVVGLLREMGLTVLEAVDGQEGMVAWKEHQPELVLTDLDMPVLDGFGLLQQIRADPGGGDVPVVVLSTRGSDEDKRRAADLGADAYLVKSEFHEEQLARTVRRYVGLREKG